MDNKVKQWGTHQDKKEALGSASFDEFRGILLQMAMHGFGKGKIFPV